MDYKKLIAEEREKIRKELELFIHAEAVHQSSTIQSDKADDESSKLKLGSKYCVNGVSEGKTEFRLTLPNRFELSSYAVGSHSDICYVPDAISKEQELLLSDMIQEAGVIDKDRWKQLRTRRLQCWGKFPPSSDRTTQENNTEIEEFIPSWLDSILDELVARNIFDESIRPNNILINQYTPVEGILHHTDGPIYHDKVAIISLNSDCIMTFRHHLSSSEIGSSSGGRSGGDVFSVLLRRCSLLYFSKDVYSEYMHGIESMREVQIVGGDGVLDSNGEEICQCINLTTANAIAGDEIRRGVRTSLTFRKLKG